MLKMKKLLAAVTAAATAFSAAAVFAEEKTVYTTIGKNEYLKANEKVYKVVSENLFHDGEFNDISGESLDQWYVGTNTSGHPNEGATYEYPVLGEDGKLKNATLVKDSGLLVKNSYETHNDNNYYYGTDTRNQSYLVESMPGADGKDGNWMNCAWNGTRSLLAYIKIDPNKTYYFQFRCYSVKETASIRYGAININDYAPAYKKAEGLKFAGSGYSNCNNDNDRKYGGNKWVKHNAVINSGNGDYFLFNAFWLQMPDFLCLDDFKLYEIEEIDSELTAETSLTAAIEAIEGVAAKDDLGITVKTSGDGYKVEYKSGDTVTTAATVEGVKAFFPAYSNFVWGISPYKTVSAKDAGNDALALTENQTIYGKRSFTSLYEEVLKELAKDSYTKDNVSSERIAKANAVIAKGGLAELASLDDTRAQIMEKATDNNSVSIKDNIFALGIGFTYNNGKLYVGNDSSSDDTSSDTAVYKTLTVSGSTVTLSNTGEDGELQAVELVYLEEVELDRLTEIIEELGSENEFEEVLDFEEIL